MNTIETTVLANFVTLTQIRFQPEIDTTGHDLDVWVAAINRWLAFRLELGMHATADEAIEFWNAMSARDQIAVLYACVYA